MEIFILGLAVGAAGSLVTGTKTGKKLIKSSAKGWMAMTERTKGMTANLREDFRDAVEEARYEREREAIDREQDAQALNGAEGMPAEKPRPGRRRKAIDPAEDRETHQAAHESEPTASH
jgi:hypothetical protein